MYKNLKKYKKELTYLGDIESYLERCTFTQKRIFQLFLEFRTAAWIKLSNPYIADRVGCSRRTVIHCTNKFHRDGLIVKHQDNKYSSNYFILHDKILDKIIQ